MKLIPLSQGKFAQVDDEDFEHLNQWKWFAQKTTSGYYAIRKENRSPIRMHRVIMNTPDGMVPDHIDRNPLNNQKHNLRNCTQAENTKNRTAWGRAKYLGVCGVNYKRNGIIKFCWRATIRINGKNVILLQTRDEKEAAKIYNEAAIKLYGEFANLNVF